MYQDQRQKIQQRQLRRDESIDDDYQELASPQSKKSIPQQTQNQRALNLSPSRQNKNDRQIPRKSSDLPRNSNNQEMNGRGGRTPDRRQDRDRKQLEPVDDFNAITPKNKMDVPPKRAQQNPPQLAPNRADDYALSDEQFSPRETVPTSRRTNKRDQEKVGQPKRQNTLEDDVTMKMPKAENLKSQKTFQTQGQLPETSSLKVSDKKSVVSNPQEVPKVEQLAPGNPKKKLQSEKLFSKNKESKIKSDQLDIKENPASCYDDATSLHGKREDKSIIGIDDGKTDRSAIHEIKIVNRKEKPNKDTVLGKPKPLSEILGQDHHKKTFLKNEDAHLYFENAEEIFNVKNVIKDAFLQPSKNDNQDEEDNYLLYGMSPEQFLESAMNPLRQISKMRANQNNSDSDSDGGDFLSCCRSNKKKDTVDSEEKKGFLDTLVIGENSNTYAVFDVFVSAMCLISSYFYGYLACGRYGNFNTEKEEGNDVVTTTVFEVFFFIHLILQFFIEFRPSAEKAPVRDIPKIAMNYLQTGFAMDFIPIIPFYAVNLKRKRQDLFYIIKMIRLIKGFTIFDVPNMMTKVKSFYHQKMLKIIENDIDMANDKDQDNNKIVDILNISYILKIFYLVVVIMNIAYLTGVFWLILCEAINDFYLNIDTDRDKQEAFYEVFEQETFISYNGLQNNSHRLNVIIAFYFAFTSLSTVGFGDFNPRGNFERFICAFVLLIGVAVFSYVMGNFIEIIEKFKDFHKELEDGDQLSRFFGTLTSFNGMKPVDVEIKQEVETYFEYRWCRDKLMAFEAEEDTNMFDQLPDEVKLNIYSDFLFVDFLEIYKSLFSFHNKNSPNQPSFYTWEDQNYQNFIIALLSNLEPRQEERHVVILEELDEVNEVIFFDKGTYEVGFEINKKRYFVIRYKNDKGLKANIIGAFEATFNKRSNFVYRTATKCHGYFIRRSKWKSITDSDEHKIIGELLKKQVKHDHHCNVSKRVNNEKESLMAKWQKRSDYSAMMYLRSEVADKNDINGKKKNDSGSDDCHEEDENEANAIEIEKMDQEIGNQYDNVKSIIQNYDHLYEQHIELKKKYADSQQEIVNLKKKHQLQLQNLIQSQREVQSSNPDLKKDYRPGQKRTQSSGDNPSLGFAKKAVTPIQKPQTPFRDTSAKQKSKQKIETPTESYHHDRTTPLNPSIQYDRQQDVPQKQRMDNRKQMAQTEKKPQLRQKGRADSHQNQPQGRIQPNNIISMVDDFELEKNQDSGNGYPRQLVQSQDRRQRNKTAKPSRQSPRYQDYYDEEPSDQDRSRYQRNQR